MKRNFIFNSFVLLLLFTLPANLVLAAEQDDVNNITLLDSSYYIGDGWTVHTGFNGFPPNDLVYGKGEYVAVGGYGTVMHSTDGYNWQAYSKFQNIHLYTIAWDGQNYVTFGAESDYLFYSYYAKSKGYISRDAKTWNEIDYSFDENIRGVIWGKDRFVAVGSKSIFTSEDGVHWTKTTPTVKGEFYGWEGVIYQNGHFFVGSSSAQHLLVSKDGINWTYKKDDALQIYNIVWTGKEYIGAGVGLYTSTDGLTWKKSLNVKDTYFYTLAYDGKTLVATAIQHQDNGKMKQLSYTSTDGKKWSSHDISNLPARINMLYATKNGFIGLGTNGDANTPDAVIAFKTIDGITWSNQIVATPGEIEAVATNGKRIVAVGHYGVVRYTDDGVNWKSSNVIPGRPILLDIVWDGKKFVAVGNNGVYYSTDGVSWKKGKVPSKDQYMHLDKIVWTGKFFVASSQVYGTYTSQDGITWTAVTKLNTNSPSHWLQSIISDGKKVLAVVETYYYADYKRSYKIMQTTNGSTWTDVATLVPKGDYAYNLHLAYNGSTYLVADQYDLGQVWTSKDGNKWSKVSSNLKGVGIKFLTSFGNQFFAMGNGLHYDEENNKIYTKETYYTSLDGKTWTEYHIPKRHADFDYSLLEVLHDGIELSDQYLFVGTSGMMMTKAKQVIVYDNHELSLSTRTGTIINVQGKTYVPLRAVAEHLGYKVLWDGQNQKVVIEKEVDGKRINEDFYVKEDTTKMISGMTYVEINHLAKKCGVTFKSFSEKGTTIFTFSK